MPLHVHRLRDSEFAASFEPEACWYGVLLWCASWHQVPAGSLPNDEKVLARMCGLGRDLATFREHRVGALHGFVECSDGRLYHPVVAEQAHIAWQKKLEQRWRTEVARIKKHNQRHGTEYDAPSLEDFLADGCRKQTLETPSYSGQSPKTDSPRRKAVPEDKGGLSLGTTEGQGRDVPRETPSKRQGQGQGQGQRESNNNDCLIGARESAPDDEFELDEEATDPALLAVASAAGFILTDDNRDRSASIVRGWIEDGLDLETVILPAIRDAMPSLKGPSSSLTRFSKIIQHANAQAKAKTAAPATNGTALKFDFDGEPEGMADLRRDIAAGLGERRYALFQSAFRLEPIPERNALQVTKTGAVQVFDDDRIAPIRKAAEKHGFSDVWSG